MLSDGGSLGGFLTFFSFSARFERGGRGGLLAGLTVRVAGALLRAPRVRFAGASLPMRMGFMGSRYPPQPLTNPAILDRIDAQ